MLFSNFYVAFCSALSRKWLFLLLVPVVCVTRTIHVIGNSRNHSDTIVVSIVVIRDIGKRVRIPGPTLCVVPNNLFTPIRLIREDALLNNIVPNVCRSTAARCCLPTIDRNNMVRVRHAELVAIDIGRARRPPIAEAPVCDGSSSIAG
jgi:hypothetical protein